MLELPNNQINYFQLKNINNWDSEDISKFKKVYENSLLKNCEETIQCLKTIYEYRLPFLQSLSFDNSKLHKIGINNFSQINNNNIKIEELIKNNKKILKEKELPIISTDEEKEIINNINNIKQLFIKYKGKIITKDTINEELKSNNNYLIAIVMNEIKNIKNIILNDSQIYSLISFLNKKKERGKIIYTSEEKVIIIICLSIILVLKGHKIDIITNNSIIVNKYFKESEIIFKKFGISVGKNIKGFNFFKNEINIEKEEKCFSSIYNNDVLFGTITQFQSDIIKDEYELKEIRQNREFDIIIIDDIDNIMIDINKRQFSTSVKNFKNYSIILQYLWMCYKQLNINKFEVIKDDKLKEIIKNYLIKKINDLINKKGTKEDNIFILSFFDNNYIMSQADKWVNSLINSLDKIKDIDYIIKENKKIEIIQKEDKIISNEIIQFLEIQNNLKMTPLRIKNKYLSNIGYIKRYIKKDRNNIYGLVNKLYPSKKGELLSENYELDFDYIFNNSNKELTSNICINHNNWIKNIIRIVKREINGGRGIFLFCENSKYCNEIYEILKNNLNSNIKLQIINEYNEDNENDVINIKLEKNNVIILNELYYNKINLDVDDNINKNSGIHIIITYIPIEDKTFIKDNCLYTKQYIIDFESTIKKFYNHYNIKDEYIKYQNLLKNDNIQQIKEIEFFSIKNINKLREEKEIKNINKINRYINKYINKEDYLFNSYCRMIKEKKELKNNIYLSSVEEKYILFLNNLDIENKNINQIKQEFDIFKNKIYLEIDKGIIITNSSFYNKSINKKLGLIYQQEKSDIEKNNTRDTFQVVKDIFINNKEVKIDYNECIKYCDESIKINSYSFIPYYLKGICNIKNDKNCIDDFNKSLIYIDEEIKNYFYIFRIFTLNSINIDSIFYKINLLNSIKTYIIGENIKYYNNNDNINNLKINLKKVINCFSFYKEKKDNFDDYYTYLKYNGLQNFYILKKDSIWGINPLIIPGIIMIGLSIISFNSYENILSKELLSYIENIINISLDLNDEFEKWIKTRNDNDLINTPEDIKDILKNKNIKVNNIEKDLENIMSKYDCDYKQKIKTENGKIFKKLFLKKINKLNLYLLKSYLNKDNDENIEKELEEKLKEIKNILNENKRKIILANNFIRRNGKDLLTNESNEINDINKILEKYSNDFYYIADIIIIYEIKKQLKSELDSKKILMNIKIEENNKNNNRDNNIENNNEMNKIINELNEIYNNIKEYIIINFDKDELKINIKKKEIKISELNILIKQIEKDSNISYNDELRKIALFELIKEKQIKIIKKRNEFEQNILNIIKENNYIWNNCFNKSKDINYKYDDYDIKKIIKYNIRSNDKLKDYFYYFLNINKDINKIKEKINNNKIILGNYLNENNMLDSFCLYPYNNTIIFLLFKSQEGKEPSKKLINIIKKISNLKIIIKINKTYQNKDIKLTEIYAIENIKIMITQLNKDKNNFLIDFEKLKFNKEYKNIEDIKTRIYPEEYIIETYEEMKERNNSMRISLILFSFYFINKEKENEINIEFLKQIYEILMNYNKINIKEKKILKNEYFDLLNIYNLYYEKKINNEQEQDIEIKEDIKSSPKALKKNNSKISIFIQSNKNSAKNEFKSQIKENNLETNNNNLENTLVRDIISENSDRNINTKFEKTNKKSKTKLIDSRKILLDSKNIIVTDGNNENIQNDYVYIKILQTGEENKEKEKQTLTEKNKIEIYNQKTKQKNCWEKFCECFKNNKK